MNCRKCDKPLDDGAYKMVAQWPFCLDCFERLLQRPPPEPQHTATDAAVADTAAAASRRCLICESSIEEGAYEQIGPWTFCYSCFAALTTPPVPPAMPDEDAAPAEEAAPQASRGPSNLYELRREQRVQCAGCKRRIPAAGSRELDGEPYCPECFRLRAAADTPKSAGATAAADEKSAGCASCGLHVAAEGLEEVEGFTLCAACRSTDLDLALHLARMRHLRRLQRLKHDLEG